MRTLWFLPISLIMILLSGNSCSRNLASISTQSGYTLKQALEKPAAFRSNLLAIDILGQLEAPGENAVFSPYSISTALAMAYLGSAGNTRREMAATLYFNPNQNKFLKNFGSWVAGISQASGDTLLKTANGMWVQQDYVFRQSYLDAIGKHFEANLSFADFRGGNIEPIRSEINKWVSSETRERINQLIQPNVLSVDTRLVLVNALYFQSNWSRPFNPEVSGLEYFHNHDGTRKQTYFMNQTGRFRHYSQPDFHALEMPYMGGAFSMIIILPTDGKNYEDFENAFSAGEFHKLLHGLQERRVRVALPRFSINMQTNLRRILAQLGMPEAFTDIADFSGMTGRKDLKIDHVVHQANIDVAEAGTEAAAATAVVITQKSLEVDSGHEPVFRADRPFLFALVENSSGTILFLGRQMQF